MANRNQLSFNTSDYYAFNTAAPVNYSLNNGKGVLGSFDGLFLQPPNSTWKAYPASTPEMKNPIFVQFSSGGPLKNEVVPMDLSSDMFIFAKNRASPFCSSNYSTSNGQVCTTTAQQDLIGLYRGNNTKYEWSENPQV